MDSKVENHSKEDTLRALQGKIDKLNTPNNMLDHVVELSVNDNLSLCELNESLPCVELSSLMNIDNVVDMGVPTLVDPVDDRLDFSCEINLCPPSVDTCDLNVSTLSCDMIAHTLVDPTYDRIDSSSKINLCPTSEDIYVDEFVCYDSLLIEELCDMPNESQISDDVDIIDHVDSHEQEIVLKNDVCLYESEITCLESSTLVDCPLFRDNILFDVGMTSENGVSSGMHGNVENVATFGSYKVFSNPLCDGDTLPEEGASFFRDFEVKLGHDDKHGVGEVVNTISDGEKSFLRVCDPLDGSTSCFGKASENEECSLKKSNVQGKEPTFWKDYARYSNLRGEEMLLKSWHRFNERKGKTLSLGYLTN
ncbi:uncharacterized protein LOC132641932 isoform X1 [Lycium barbarum]|uniref:uncharacterized protein LOC132641932 isoform X1 n=1 Tax=Lycium barbarum TaxID=112863 RepID=UPI00293F101E|nr:uncharacterized protein LOC132641932 isoform X1 [Lycium barbarum]XP_060215054.1 uncharacterized protein LOC132641932 isoform X1 [Lycium barbarum]XP_060215055.1 uncharacterized protein LOC132641932 isoform X1 [Lycium barbarum]